MATMNGLWRRLTILFGRDRFRGELEEEMAFHRAEAEKQFIAEGMSPSDAHQAAARQFGNATVFRERSQEAVGFRWETVAQDLRFALRQLGKNPGFAATAIVILALGIGASVAIFAFVDAALIKPLPYANPTRLMAVDESSGAVPAQQSFVCRLRGLEALEHGVQFAGCVHRNRLRVQHADRD